MAHIEIEDLTVEYELQDQDSMLIALWQVSLSIDQGEFVVMVGPSGCGKTTLLKTINRELYPVVRDDSWVRILGRERWNVWELRRKIGVVSHDLHSRYTPTTTALEVVASGFQSSIGIHGLLASRVKPGQLARALVHQPETLILDEPTAGLDIAAGFDYLRQIRRLASEGHNIVIVTHHLNEIPLEVDRIVLMKAGAIVADGSKEQTLTDDLLSTVYEIPVRVANIDGHFLAYPG